MTPKQPSLDQDDFQDDIVDLLNDPEGTVSEWFLDNGKNQTSVGTLLKPFVPLACGHSLYLLGDGLDAYQKLLQGSDYNPGTLYLSLLVIGGRGYDDPWSYSAELDRQLSKIWLMVSSSVPNEERYRLVRATLSEAHSRVVNGGYLKQDGFVTAKPPKKSAGKSDRETSKELVLGPEASTEVVASASKPSPFVAGCTSAIITIVSGGLLLVAYLCGIVFSPFAFVGAVVGAAAISGLVAYRLASQERGDTEPETSWAVTSARLEQHILSAYEIPDLDVYVGIREIKNKYAGVSDNEAREEAIAKDLLGLINKPGTTNALEAAVEAPRSLPELSEPVPAVIDRGTQSEAV